MLRWHEVPGAVEAVRSLPSHQRRLAVTTLMAVRDCLWDHDPFWTLAVSSAVAVDVERGVLVLPVAALVRPEEITAFVAWLMQEVAV
jgi:hypothetical protein